MQAIKYYTLQGKCEHSGKYTTYAKRAHPHKFKRLNFKMGYIMKKVEMMKLTHHSIWITFNTLVTEQNFEDVIT